MTSRYAEIYESWRRNPQGFWAGIASSEIDWLKPWDKVFDPTLGVYGRFAAWRSTQFQQVLHSAPGNQRP